MFHEYATVVQKGVKREKLVRQAQSFFCEVRDSCRYDYLEMSKWRYGDCSSPGQTENFADSLEVRPQNCGIRTYRSTSVRHANREFLSLVVCMNPVCNPCDTNVILTPKLLCPKRGPTTFLVPFSEPLIALLDQLLLF